MSHMSFRGRALARLAVFCLGTSALTAVLLGSVCTPANAATTDWTGGTGDWSTAGNWSVGVPGAGDIAVIGNGGTAQIASTAAADTVNIANGSSVILLSGGALNATNIYVGSNGGVLSSGTLVISSASAPGTTTFNLNGTLRATTTTTTASNIIFDAGTDSAVSVAAGATLNLTGNLAFNNSAVDGDRVIIGSATDTGTVYISSTNVTVGANAGALEIAGGTLKDISTTTPQSAFTTALGNLKSVTIDSGATLEIDSNGNGRGPTAETYIKLFGGGQLVMGGSDLPRVVLGNSNFAGQISGAGYIGIGGVANSTMPSTVILTGNNNSALEFQIATGSVLQIGNGGTSGSLANTAHIVGYSYPSSGNAVLEFDRSDNVTLGSGLNGSLVLQQSGTGILTVSGNNSVYPPGDFYGSVVVSSGGLSISSDNNLSGNPIALKNATTLYTTASGTYTSSVTVAGDPTFNVAAGTTTTWSGKITNGGTPGEVEVTGGGTLILANASNSYSGGTVVKGGSTLQIGADSNIGASSGGLALGDVTTAGTLQLDASFNLASTRSLALGAGGGTINTNGFSTTISQAISGSGALTKTGGGTLILMGANTYTGGTIVNGGVLQLGSGASIAGSGSLTVNGGTFDQSGNNVLVGTLSGTGGAITLGSGALTTSSSADTNLATVISGSGSFFKAGTGILTLAGANTYAGATNVNAGALNVTGSIASSSVSVASGATLTGTGKVGATSVASGGTLALGASGAPGSLTIAGNLTLASGANFVDGVTPTAAGLASVSGAASINGNALANFASGTYASGQQYTLITAAGGVSGTFSSFATTGLPASLRASLTYDANDVYLNLKPNVLAPSLSSNTTTNQHNVVVAIDAAVTGGAVPTGGFNALYGLSGAALNSAIDQISGQIGPNVGNAVGQSFLSFLGVTADGGAGDTGSYAPGSAYGAAAAPHRAQLGLGQTRVWGGAYGGHVGLSADATSGAAGLSASNVGLIGGADMQLGDGILAGATLNWGRQHFNSGNGSGISTDYAIGLYGRADMDAAYVTAAFGYGWHQITTLRVVTVSGTDVLQGKQNADDFGGRIEAGWRMPLDDSYTIAPYGAFTGESFESPAYAETALSGASTFALSYAANTSTLGRSELGAHLDRGYALNDARLTADVRAAWAHELDDLPFAQANFENLATASFQVLGVRPARDTMLLGADLELQYGSGLFLGLKGEGQFGVGTTVLEGVGSFGLRW